MVQHEIVKKTALRVQFKNELSQLNSEERAAQSQQLCDQLQSFFQDQSGLWTLFSPLNDEPNLLSLLKTCPKVTFVFPKVESASRMNFYHVRCMDEMVTTSWGLTEPTADCDPVSPNEIAGCVVPGLAFSNRGERLGRGGGFYDRFLQDFKGLKLGVTFNEAFTNEALPRESHDQLMDIVVSPSEWVDLRLREVSHGT